MKKLFLLLILLLATATLVTAVQPTQQYYKSYINPFYVASMANGVNQTYNLTVAPPDGVGQVTAAIVNFNAQINGQTQTFTLWVNGQSCNNPTYSVATAFSTTGNIQFAFDCSNRITKAGTYTITLQSAVNTGAVSGWLDLTYLNNPFRDMNVYGTEYTPGQNGTIFINLLTNQNLATSLCSIDIFYPNKTYYYSGPLTQLPSNLALFYKDFVVPDIQGVYMAAATCVQPLVTTNQTRYFNRQSTVFANYSNQTLVNYTNATQQTYAFGSLTTRTCTEPDWIDTQAQVMRINSINNVSVWLLAGASRAGVIEVNFYRFNRNTLQRGDIGSVTLSTTIANSLTRYSLGNLSTYADFTASDSLLAEVCITNNGGATPFTFYYGNTTTNSGFLMNTNTIDNTTSQTIEYHGGGEIHVNAPITTSSSIVSDVWNYTNRSLTNYDGASIAPYIWNYTNRELTYYNMTDTTNYTRIDAPIYAVNQSINANIDYTRNNLTTRINLLESTLANIMYAINNSIITQILSVPLNVWTYSIRNLTYYQVNNISASDIWTYNNRNLTYYENFTQPQVDMTNYTAIYQGVWTYVNRNLTYYENFTQPQVDMTNYTLINQGVSTAVWVYATRNLTYYENFTQPQVDMTNYSKISNLTAQEVWEYTNRNLTYYAPAYVNTTEVAVAVWDYNTRNLTYYPAQQDMTNYQLIGLYVWNETNRNLTYYPPQVDMTNYTRIDQTIYAVNTSLYNKIVSETDLVLELVHNENNLTWIQIAGVPGSVWNYTNRSLTYYAPAFVDNNAVAIAVWNSTTRNLTYYPTQVDLTNYSLINQGVWTYIDRNLTYFPAQVDLTNYSTINSGVWTYNNRNLTYYPTATDLTNYTLINEGVWTYNNRNLTYYPTQIDLTNYSKISNLTAGEVWTYATRDLTYYQVNNISAADVWTYINRTLTYYQINNITATDVWAYNNRTLTYYPSQQDLTNYTAIWTYPDRNLTYYAPAYVNNTAVAQETWGYPARYTHGELITG